MDLFKTPSDIWNFTSRRGYCVAIGGLLCFALYLQSRVVPFEVSFFGKFLPALLFVSCLQWFMLRVKPFWMILGFLSAALISLGVWFLAVRLGWMGSADFATALYGWMIVFYVTLWFVGRKDAPLIILSTGLCTSFLIFVGFILTSHHATGLGFSQGKFLLVSPIAALFVIVVSDQSGWSRTMQVIFICIIIQIAMGLLDAGQGSNIALFTASAVILAFVALGVAAFWARGWNR
jgi:hypothetical protein